MSEIGPFKILNKHKKQNEHLSFIVYTMAVEI